MLGRLVTTAAMIGATIFAMVLSTDAALADKRVALVIGNSKYQSVQQLPNPARDANAVAQLLRDAHFDSVDVGLNLGIVEFRRAIRKFEEEVDQADVAVIYYAGHGFEINGTNYLIPVDAQLNNDRDAEDEAVPLDLVLSRTGSAKKFRVIVLDACRDNPFSGRMQRSKKSVSRSITGLGSIDLSSTTDTLTAYAAKLGSTAEDGDGEHSPFTTALLKNLTVPGLDVRMAFGRIKTEVMAATNGHQEPFVYGSLGGDTYALVPAPVAPTEVPVAEMKADYDLIASINTRRAWEVYLSRYKTGPYVDRARQQLASLSDQVPQPTVIPQGSPSIAAVSPNVIAPGREPSSKEALEWNKVKDSTDPAALQRFIGRFPDSPLSINAQQRMDLLKKAAQEREDKARADREAAIKAAEQVRIEAAQKKAEIAAAQKRDEDERRAKAAEAEQKARAAEAERKAAEAKQKAEEAGRTKEASEAAALRAASEKQAREAETERKRAELATAQEAACKQEQGKLDELTAKGSQGSGVDNLKSFAGTITCNRLGPVAVAALDKFTAEAAKRAAALPNSPELLRSAQTQLARLGCLTGKADGTLSTTKSALGRYNSIQGQKSDTAGVTEAVVANLTKQTVRVCPLECKTGEKVKGETCVANVKPSQPVTASRHKDEDDAAAHRKPSPRQAEREQPRQSRPAPQVQQQATARPSSSGGGAPMTGVGF
jgi:Caspase domain